MAIHDAYARLTPYEMLLPDAAFPDRHFPGIADEAGQRGVDPANPAAFVMLGQVQAALAELRAEDAAPESSNDHVGVLFFAYHFWETGATVVLTQQKTMRALLAGDSELPKDGRNALWSKELVGRAGYVQLPQHLVWLEEARNDPQEEHGASQAARDVSQETRNVSPAGRGVSQETRGNPPESVDGFFWFGDSHGALHLTLVAGMRGDRPGFAVVPVPPLPLDSLDDWATGPAREGRWRLCDLAARRRTRWPPGHLHAGRGVQAGGAASGAAGAGAAASVPAAGSRRSPARHTRGSPRRRRTHPVSSPLRDPLTPIP